MRRCGGGRKGGEEPSPTKTMRAGLDASGPEGDAEFFVDHEGEDAHLGGAAVVEFDAA
eukprot:CAMPEP_0198643740 /NCGR_PEP_ID=MMETSP1467-20131203/24_1 /TAXON_ID=1462469 /ORGANISM="unid. sp., Strain CCMP2135" /LENGTH=57 /DNA_ID=CAMNT_0044379145 /DNA_START=75 /DNA_END=244 /DNA_ORIENTATION=+